MLRLEVRGVNMKARIQSIDKLKEIAIRELQTEIDQQISDALLDGAAQGIAFVLWVLDISFGWKDVRQHKLFDAMKSVIALRESWVKPVNGDSLVSYIKEKFDIDVDKLLQEECSTTVAQNNPDVKTSGN